MERCRSWSATRWTWRARCSPRCLIQRLGRLNRDGRDNEAKAWFWETPERDGGKKKQERIGPYDADDVERAKKLVDALIPVSNKPFAEAVRHLEQQQVKDMTKALQPKLAPLPRALDVHGLFSTERDVHGGFTDVSAFVRGTDPDADLTVFWRDWEGAAPPRGDDLDGPPLDIDNEGCPVPFFRLRDALKARRAVAWTWNDEDDIWERVAPRDLRPGMVIMLNRDVGGYNARLGWTGEKSDVLRDVPRAGRGRALRDDERTEAGYWASLDTHLADAGLEAERLCAALGLDDEDQVFPRIRTAIIEGAALHDLGKEHPQWQQALPAVSPLPGGPWAKCPRVLAVDVRASDAESARAEVGKRLSGALAQPDERRWPGREERVRLRWAVAEKLKRQTIEELKGIGGVRWVGHVPFRPGMRHETASALAMWRRYREGGAPYPALAVYLAAAHHGKVRTVLRTTTDRGDDVFGVPRDPDALDLSAARWPLDFSVAKDGAEGEWREETGASVNGAYRGSRFPSNGYRRSSEGSRPRSRLAWRSRSCPGSLCRGRSRFTALGSRRSASASSTPSARRRAAFGDLGRFRVCCRRWCTVARSTGSRLATASRPRVWVFRRRWPTCTSGSMALSTNSSWCSGSRG